MLIIAGHAKDVTLTPDLDFGDGTGYVSFSVNEQSIRMFSTRTWKLLPIEGSEIIVAVKNSKNGYLQHF